MVFRHVMRQRCWHLWLYSPSAPVPVWKVYPAVLWCVCLPYFIDCPVCTEWLRWWVVVGFLSDNIIDYAARQLGEKKRIIVVWDEVNNNKCRVSCSRTWLGITKEPIHKDGSYLMRQFCVLSWEQIKTKNLGAAQHYAGVWGAEQ